VIVVACREQRVVIIVRNEESAQQALTDGVLVCPHGGCGGGFSRDGYARARRVRTRDGGERELRPQRVVCRRCGRSNVLLPAWCVPGRCDDAETIGVALLAAAQGQGHRVIAAGLGRPASTVRGWLRAFRSQADALRQVAWSWQGRIEPVSDERQVPVGSPLGDALGALGAAAAAARRVFGLDRYATTSAWEYLVLITAGRLVRPPRPPRPAPGSRLNYSPLPGTRLCTAGDTVPISATVCRFRRHSPLPFTPAGYHA
jgi:hypothetical protein